MYRIWSSAVVVVVSSLRGRSVELGSATPGPWRKRQWSHRRPLSARAGA